MLNKQELIEARLKELQEELLKTLLNRRNGPTITPEELPVFQTAIQERVKGESLGPDHLRILLKAFLLVDGCTDASTGVNQLVKQRLNDLQVSTESLAENFAPELISLICDKEEITGAEDQPIKYLQIKHIELFKIDPELSEYSRISSLRKKVAILLDLLLKFKKLILKNKPTEKQVNKLRELDKKVKAAEDKLKASREKAKDRNEAAKKAEDEKKMKADLKEKLRRDVEEKKKKEAEEKEEKKREEESKKEDEKRKKEEEKRKKDEEKEEERKKKEEDRKKRDEERDEEKRKKEEEKKKEEEYKEKSKVQLTKFFTTLTKTQENEAQDAINEEKTTIWKKGLGSSRLGQDWNEERRIDFENLMKSLYQKHSIDHQDASKMDIELEVGLSCSKLFESMKSHIAGLKEDSHPARSEKMDDELEEKARPVPRKIFIKYEDYLNDCYEYRGLFKRRSNFVTARRPISKDEDLIDYELSSDEEFQLEEADSINSKAADEDQEESGNDEEEDNFVVPDGYLSEEEFGSLDEDDKRRPYLPQVTTKRESFINQNM